MVKLIKISALIAVVSIFFSCKTWSIKEWDNLKDRKFYFSKIEIYKKGMTKKSSFEYMKMIPVFKILQILSTKYNIEIDSSHYENFLVSENYDIIKASGILSNTTFVWNHPFSVTNEIVLEYKIDTDEVAGGNVQSYRIYLETGKEVRALFFAGIGKIDEVMSSAAGELGFKRIPEKGPNAYLNKETGKEIVLADKKLQKIKKEMNFQMSKSELLIINVIENYIKLLPQEERKSFKEKLIRYLDKQIK